MLRGTSYKRCVAYFSGRSKRATLEQIPRAS